ncbi:hypothetical protein QE152_g29088 [Popillia japonica]|uniref:Uncharacterized protein n=1 Tax=Popillia japonica TaxID=7064 RepID=A0AAW1JKB4_POPJA
MLRLSNVKALTRKQVRFAPYNSEDSNSSVESLSLLASRIGKIHDAEENNGRPDVRANDITGENPQQPEHMSDMDIQTSQESQGSRQQA